MNREHSYPFPQVFLVDNNGGPEHTLQPPNLVPCWSFPPAQERLKVKGKSRYCMGSSSSLVVCLLFLLLLVFAALGLGAHQIYKLQIELSKIKQHIETEIEVLAPEKQVGLPELQEDREKTQSRPAAHVIGRIQKDVSQKTLRWEPKSGRAYTEGGVVYQDGGLQINHSGLYHVYSRVEFLSKHCTPTDALSHSVFVKRLGHLKPLTLMEGHREGFCSESKGRVWTSGSHLGSTLQLQNQDWLFVNVSHPTLLSHNFHGNYFGLHQI
ncbi:tumor necrosis factor ligand superfamily member 6 [Aplochiton taeniatus]